MSKFVGTRCGMQIHLLKSKIHRARVTGASLDYEGSLTIDANLISASVIRHSTFE